MGGDRSRVRRSTGRTWALPALSVALEQMDGAAFVIARDGTVLLANRAARSLLDEDEPGVAAALRKAAGSQPSPFRVTSSEDGTVLLAVLLGRSPDADGHVARVATEWCLTPREREVLRLVIAGCSNGDIAQRLELSVRTVETYIARLLERAGVRSRAELTALVFAD
jgi:DNA-binding CsgD family transcriptional regulator